MYKLHVSAIKYSLPNLYKLSIPKNCIEFANDAWVLLNFHWKYSKTKTISNTCGKSRQTTFNIIVRSNTAERLLTGRKHFLQSVMVSVAVSKPAKTDLGFVQPGANAKISCVNYCKNVLEQGLLSAIRRISNNDFVVQQDTAPAHRSHHTAVA